MDHTFCGIWEISESSLDGKPGERTGLEGIKFRLDEMGDIIWYNDLINPVQDKKKSPSTEMGFCSNNESANTLFSCETFEIVEITSNGPGLIFGAYAGLSIEFKTNTYCPGDQMTLVCDEWCSLLCRRVKENQSVGQEAPFTLLPAQWEGYFSDVVIKSTDNIIFHVHSPILRLNGFDCSLNYQSIDLAKTFDMDSPIKILTPSLKHINRSHQDLPNILPLPSSSNNFLSPPAFNAFNFSPRLVSNISNSFNCLATAKESDDYPKKYPSASSDSNLKYTKNIFNFSNTHLLVTEPVVAKTTNFKPPPSPFRVRSPSSFFDTPPSSPLTPVSVLYNLPSFMLTPIVHWLYAECLPNNLDDETCEKLISIGESTPPLNKIVEPCRKYLRNIKIKKFVIDVVMDIHSIMNKIIHEINPQLIPHSATGLCQIFRHGIRDGAIACAKLLQFCNIFVKDASNLTRYQRYEIIKYIRTRLPIFMSQFHQLLQNILAVFLSLTIEEKSELIHYLVPEIENSLETMIDLITELKLSLEKMCLDLRPAEHFSRSKEKSLTPPPVPIRSRSNTRKNDENLLQATGFVEQPTSPKRYVSSENDLKFVLYMYEVKKMRDIYGKITTALEIIQNKKVSFKEMTTMDKQRTVHRNLEQLILEMPSYIRKLEEVSDSIDEKIGWKEFKFCFKLATSQINGVISKLLDHKSALMDAIVHICQIVERDQFTQAITELGLLEENNKILKNDILNQNDETFKTSSTQFENLNYNTSKLNLIKNLCEPPIVSQSSLSKNALRLLHSGQLSDMEFEIQVNNSNSDHIINDDDDSPPEIHTFKAHRVIIAGRCEWFRKALLSGMQEDINRKIIIHDTSPVIFRRLLLYLYGAPIDKTVGVEQICELMLLADRYSVDDLKDICETTLLSLIDDQSVICLLGIADQFTTTALKADCLSYMSQHGNLVNTDMFLELPKMLQHEVQDLIQWCGRIPEPWGDRDRSSRDNSSRHSLKSPSKNSKSRSRRSSPSYM